MEEIVKLPLMLAQELYRAAQSSHEAGGASVRVEKVALVQVWRDVGDGVQVNGGDAGAAAARTAVVRSMMRDRILRV